jgi:hypothetical protein
LSVPRKEKKGMAAADIDYGGIGGAGRPKQRKRKETHAAADRHVNFADESIAPSSSQEDESQHVRKKITTVAAKKGMRSPIAIADESRSLHVPAPPGEQEEADYVPTEADLDEAVASGGYAPLAPSTAGDFEAQREDIVAAIATNLVSSSSTAHQGPRGRHKLPTKLAKRQQEEEEGGGPPVIPPFFKPMPAAAHNLDDAYQESATSRADATEFMEVQPIQQQEEEEQQQNSNGSRDGGGRGKLLDFSQTGPRSAGSRMMAATKREDSNNYWWGPDARPIDQVPPTSPGPLYVLPAAASAAASAAVPRVGVYYLQGKAVRAVCIAKDPEEARDLLEREAFFNGPAQQEGMDYDTWLSQLRESIVRLDTNKPMKAILCASQDHGVRSGAAAAHESALARFVAGATTPSSSPAAASTPHAHAYTSAGGRIRGASKTIAAVIPPHEPKRTTAGPCSLSVWYVNDHFSGVALARNKEEAISFFDTDLYYHAQPSHEERPYVVTKLDLSAAPVSVFLCSCA